MSSCDRCKHSEDNHRDNICYGDIGCTCIKLEISPEMFVKMKQNSYLQFELVSRTSIRLPQPITTHDNWSGKGWHYKKKWNKTQREMVKFLIYRCGLSEDETRIFLRCKNASVRGRLSEIRSKPRYF